MNPKRTYSEEDLASLARQARVKAGKSQKEVAYEFRVKPPAISFAETAPKRSLLRLRKAMIEKYSDYKVVGPEFRLVRKR